MGAARFQSFGRVFAPATAWIGAEEAVRRLQRGDAAPDSLLAFGNGRSYGDSCLNPSGTLIEMRGMNRILAFDPASGVLEAEAGTLLADIIAYAAPLGYFPQVLPGTQFVTLGGAIANDVHGKNHHRRGTFGNHVVALTLLRSDGRTYRCSPEAYPQLFAATVGGMGLTGMILSASIRLMPVPSVDILERVTPFGDLCEFFDRVEEADLANEYAVAWIDQMARKKSAGRGLLMTGNHAEQGSLAAASPGRAIRVPFELPFNVLNPPVLRVFNKGYHVMRGLSQGPHRSPYQRFFFQLDAVGCWNRLYGPRGFFQHQSVVPEETARHAVPALLETAEKAGQGSFLSVLKRFGSVRSPGIVSFPRPGYTLTMDFPNRGPSTLALMARLDALAIEAGGGVNPYKDARMDADTFAATFPHWEKLERFRDPAFTSRFWQRTAGQLLERPHDNFQVRAAE